MNNTSPGSEETQLFTVFSANFKRELNMEICLISIFITARTKGETSQLYQVVDGDLPFRQWHAVVLSGSSSSWWGAAHEVGGKTDHRFFAHKETLGLNDGPVEVSG